jgi:hypothetical protein
MKITWHVLCLTSYEIITTTRKHCIGSGHIILRHPVLARPIVYSQIFSAGVVVTSENSSNKRMISTLFIVHYTRGMLDITARDLF